MLTKAAVFIFLFACTLPAQRPVKPPKLSRPPAASHVVTGFAAEAKLPVRVKLFDGEGKLLEQHDVLPDSDGQGFVAGFKTELSEGQVLLASHLRGDSEVSMSVPVTVLSAPALGETAKTVPSVPVPVPAVPAPVQSGSKGNLKTAVEPKTANNPPPPTDPAPSKQWGPCDKGNSDDTSATPELKAESGLKKLAGRAAFAQGKVTVCVNGDPLQIGPAGATTFSTDGVDFKDSAYSIALKDPLSANQKVLVVMTADGEKRASADATVVTRQPVSTAVVVQKEVIAGSDNVKVSATPTPADEAYEVRLRPCAGSNLNLKTSDSKPYVVTSETGDATLTFDKPLFEGQEIEVCQTVAEKTTGKALTFAVVDNATPKSEEHPEKVAVTDAGDLGRFRFYFTSGIVLSSAKSFATQTSGTDAGIFLGLAADRAWLPGKKETPENVGWRPWNIHTYFDARLTQVATQQASTTTTTPTPATPSTASAAHAATANASNTTLDSFAQSAKAATLQGGIYVPFVSQTFHGGLYRDNYSLFMGPLAKTGFVTLTDSPTAPAGTLASAEQVSGRFFTNYAYGVRLGVFRHHQGRDSAPELVDWVDITKGRFGGFEAFRDSLKQIPDAGADPTMARFITVRPWRWQFEGQLKVPRTPFVLGFNANVGSGAVAPFKDKAGVLYPYAQPKDDLRFLFGAQFDFSKFLKILPQIQ